MERTSLAWLSNIENCFGAPEQHTMESNTGRIGMLKHICQESTPFGGVGRQHTQSDMIRIAV